ncbi:LytR C-terminal domain-containing protein [Corynebacterium urealyticum]|uniref:LytR C-terminal domain-containing protein n=1 Tax=Corynebacterium urealyticum TaxID=43771 RepID=UPI0021CCD467|nr:LytR C-terminal domain-containing protein [Corynebacterium urealyticum]
MTDSNRPRHSLDENFDDDRPLNLEPQHGAHQGPVDAEFEDAEYSDYDADGYDADGYESYDDGYGEHEDYAAGYAGYHDGDYAEYDDEYAEYEDEYGDSEYEDYDDESAAAAQRHHEAGRRRIGGAAVAGAAGAGAAGAAGAGSAGATGAGEAGAAAGEPGGQVGAEARSGQGLPLRGLAMVLIAVAIALIAWGAVSFVNGDSKDGTVQAGQGDEDTSNLSPAEQARLAKEKENAERQAARDKAANDAKAEEAKKAEAEKKAAEEAENAENQGALSDKDREATHVTVLNNSPIEGLAGRTADGLRGEKWDAKTIGNLPDSAYVFRESVVLYPAGDAKAKAAAEQIAKEHGLEARERNREIDDSLRDVQLLDGPAPGAVIVVTVNDMPR